MRAHRRGQGWNRLWQCVGGAGVLGFVLTVFSPLPNWLFDRLTTPPMVRPADAVVVLGAGIGKDGILSKDSLRRAVHGMLLWRAHEAPVLVFSGPSFEHSPVEAEVRAAMAKAFGVAPDAIVTEKTANTTREEALRIGAELRPLHARRILLVTDSMHMRRAQALFEAAGFQVLPASADTISGSAKSPEGRLELMRWVLGETVARVYYRLAGYL